MFFPRRFAVPVFVVIFLLQSCASSPQTEKKLTKKRISVPSQQIYPLEGSRTTPESQPSLLPPAPIEILGGVKDPGRIPFQPGADLTFYLSKAGGTPSNALPEKIQIIRGDPGKKKAEEFQLVRADSAPALKSGDIVIVHSRSPSLMEKAMTYAASAVAVVGAFALLLVMV